MKKIIILLISTLVLFGCNFAVKKNADVVSNPQVKSATSSQDTNQLPNVADSKQEEEIKIPDFIDLKAPFVSQAPLNNWDDLHNEGCEEASVLSVVSYLENKELSREEQDAEIVKMVNFQMNLFGGHFDLPAEKVKEFVEKYYNNKYKVQIIYDPSMDDIKKQITLGNPLIIPASGRTIANPHYRGLGPVYHMMVLRGFDANMQEFITNDVGTHHTGDGYRFKMSVVYDAIHDMPKWGQKKNDLDRDPQMIFNGRKAIIIITK